MSIPMALAVFKLITSAGRLIASTGIRERSCRRECGRRNAPGCARIHARAPALTALSWVAMVGRRSAFAASITSGASLVTRMSATKK